jgi:hypothetical protein
MFDLLVQELVTPEQPARFLGERKSCRYCGAHDQKAFGKKKNAHTFPAGLGNNSLFSLDECITCNGKFSIYEDALIKAVGPFLTLGGVSGRNGIRQTGRSRSPFQIKHDRDNGGRQISIKAIAELDDVLKKISPRVNYTSNFLLKAINSSHFTHIKR